MSYHAEPRVHGVNALAETLQGDSRYIGLVPYPIGLRGRTCGCKTESQHRTEIVPYYSTTRLPWVVYLGATQWTGAWQSGTDARSIQRVVNADSTTALPGAKRRAVALTFFFLLTTRAQLPPAAFTCVKQVQVGQGLAGKRLSVCT